MSFKEQVLGTIISSVLNYDQLCPLMRETPAIDNTTSSYVPCDGRSIVGSALEKLTRVGSTQPDPNNHITTSPDLRGKFLRGLNVIYDPGQPMPFDSQTLGDPDGHRHVGAYQADQFKDHVHGYQRYVPSTLTDISNDTDQRHTGGESGNTNDNTGLPNTGSGKDETRPRNVSVYFYIKIN